ncbi:metallothionein [Aggregicoccus sp. 17bor-14]|uniref:metallothionein n=1 Tax=Myxococcaceae TaxID=31 RepID=UPI00129CBBB0|nr:MULTISPECIES: metallothionein [Myxococcaceae]MBF5041484.1 metallothionein [Simulacricoccus sp. 17bor-14]MRI87268.1 metallothionein [Aggregicoccus sp. 17bor-14]
MMRKGTFGAVLLVASLVGVPGAARACEKGKPCHCAHAEAKPAPAAAQATTEQQQAHDALVKAGQKLLAAKCSCGSKGDCTCKKGQCQCAKCGGRHEGRAGMVEALEGQSGGQALDADVRYDASAGVLL